MRRPKGRHPEHNANSAPRHWPCYFSLLAEDGHCGYISHMREWSIRDAKDHLSELVAAAQQGPQAITKRGRPAVVVLSKDDYERLQRQLEPLTSFFARAGLEDIAIERVEAAGRNEGEI
jgi:prevent-host-death family protein